MRKILLIFLIFILVVSCAKVEPQKATQKTTQTESITTKTPVATPEAEEETEPERTVTTPTVIKTTEPEQQGALAMHVSLNSGETKTVTLGDKDYTIKLLSVSNRAQFSVNGEITKDLLLTGTHVLRDGTELTVIELGYNSAFIKLMQLPAKELGSIEVQTDVSGPASLMKAIFRTVEKKTAGTAEIIRTMEGGLLLTFTSFQTEPGPGLYVYLADQSIADGYEVAKLFSREGNQQYSLPKDIDLRKYTKIVVYSKSEQKVYGEAKAT